MTKGYRQGATGALLDEYEKAITALKECIAGIRDAELTAIADAATTDANCVSVQTVLSHVVSSAYSYAVYIDNFKGSAALRPAKTFRSTAAAYIRDLEQAFQFTVAVFDHIRDEELEQPDPAGKILTAWGQVYDIEQMMEHAIVHILRHRRQIEKFRKMLASS